MGRAHPTPGSTLNSTGQIAAQYTFDGSFPGYTVRWYHYDRLGSVMNQTDGNANVVASYDQDAYGNTISNMTTGQWASSISGRHLTTKEADADAGLYYFWQRWYEPGVGRFISKAKYEPYIEHPYILASSAPTIAADPRGELVHLVVPPFIIGMIVTKCGVMTYEVTNYVLCMVRCHNAQEQIKERMENASPEDRARLEDLLCDIKAEGCPECKNVVSLDNAGYCAASVLGRALRIGSRPNPGYKPTTCCGK